MSEMTDSKLQAMLGSADHIQRNKALNYIYRHNYQAIATYIQKNSGRPEDAEDIFQDGLIALYEQVLAGRFKQQSSMSTYLFAICRNLWNKRLRKSSTKNESLGVETDFAEKGELVLDSLIASEESKTLADLLEQIGADCKKVLLLYYYERKRMKEIAELLGFAGEQVAKNKKNRCLKKLKTMAQEVPGFKPF